MADTLVRQEQIRRDLVADVAHELRNPVAVLQANTEALLDGVVPRTPEQIASLYEEVVRLAGLVNDLQALASAEAAALHLDLTRCDLAALAQTAAQAMSATAASAAVELHTDVQSAFVVADPARIHQVITNLLSNAVKFTPSGGEVTVRVRSEGDTATLIVADTGPGLDADEAARVFERFWRGRNAAKRTGTGIGLAIVANLVNAHGGHVTVSSTPGEGAQFTVRLPAAR